MKKKLKSVLCLCLSFVCLMLTACGNGNDDDSNTANEEYYAGLGYHKIEFDSFTSVVCESTDKVTLTETSIMVPNNTEISLEFNLSSNTSFSENNGNYIDFSNGLLLSGFSVGEKFYEINNASFKVKDDLTISVKLNKFNTIGVAVYALTNINNDVTIPTGKMESIPASYNNPLYFYSSTAAASGFAKDNLITNTELNSTVTNLENNKFKIEIFMSVFYETVDAKICLILVDEENNFYFSKVTYSGTILNTNIEINKLSNVNSNLDSITLKLGTSDVKDEYERQ